MSATDQDLEGLSDEGRRLWAVARGLNRACAGVSRRSLPPLLFFTDPRRTPEPWVTARRLPPGAGVVYRHFGAREAGAVARRLREATRERGVRLLIGLDADLAQAVAADGVHLPQYALDQAPSLRRRMPGGLITGAVHHGIFETDDRLQALDAMVASPVFATASPSPGRPLLGAAGLRALAERLARPVYGLGGVNAYTAAALIDSGACGLAGVEGIVRAFADGSEFEDRFQPDARL